MWIKFNGSSKRRQSHACICGSVACAELSKDYYSINDVRGTHCQAPVFNTREWEALATKSAWEKLLDTIDDKEHKKKE